MSRTSGISTNLSAFLDVIAIAEGTFYIGDEGYNVLFGATEAQPLLFESYAKHPNVRRPFRYKNGASGISTAAGRYQILNRIAKHYISSLRLPDFGPESQDAIAIQLIRECKALTDIDAGYFDSAIDKCKSRWASLPGAGYNQPELSLTGLRIAFAKRGGTLA